MSRTERLAMPETSLLKLFDPVYYMWLVRFVCCLKFWFSFRLVVLLLCYENDHSDSKLTKL